MSDYDSDESTLVNDEHHPRRRSDRSRRYRSPSEERYYPRQSQSYSSDGYAYTYPNAKGDQKSKYATIGKVAVVVGIVGILLHKWQKERTAERERQERRERHRRRKEFERAKKARRKEEERREREEEERMEPQSPEPEVRRIEYRPMERTRSRSSSGSEAERRRIDAPAGKSGRSNRGSERAYDGERGARARYED